MRRVGAVVAAGLLVLVAACSTQPERTTAPPAGGTGPSTTLGARADAALIGTVVGPDGAPLGNVPVSVVKTNTGLVLGDALTAAFTFGLSCVAAPGSCDHSAHQVDSTSTAADGTFAATLPKAYLAGYETNEDWVAQAGLPPRQGEVTGPSSSFELEVDTAHQEAPPLPLWTAAPTLHPGAGVLAVDVAPIAASGALAPKLDAVLADGKPIWRFTGPVDLRLLEDLALRVIVTGRDDVTVRHSEGRTIYHQVVASPSVAYQGTEVPLSRHAPCILHQSAAVGCPYTDGDLVTGLTHGAGHVVTVDLGRDTKVGLVVARGTDPPEALNVEVSHDRHSWRPLRTGPLGGAPGVVATSGDGLTGRYVRVSAVASGDLREVSVWTPTARSTSGVITGPGAGADWSVGHVMAAGLAALLALAVGWLSVSRLRARRPAP